MPRRDGASRLRRVKLTAKSTAVERVVPKEPTRHGLPPGYSVKPRYSWEWSVASSPCQHDLFSLNFATLERQASTSPCETA
jgi:hypothetical protein